MEKNSRFLLLYFFFLYNPITDITSSKAVNVPINPIDGKGRVGELDSPAFDDGGTHILSNSSTK